MQKVMYTSSSTSTISGIWAGEYLLLVEAMPPRCMSAGDTADIVAAAMLFSCGSEVLTSRRGLLSGRCLVRRFVSMASNVAGAAYIQQHCCPHHMLLSVT